MPGVTTAYQAGVHGSRPAASAGCILYACSTHSLIYRSDGTSWTTWMTIGSTTTTVATDAIWDAKGDLAAGTGADTASKLTVGANDTILMADSAQSAGLKWVASQTPSTQAFSDAAAEGTADTYARGDHKHAMPSAPAGSLVFLEAHTASGSAQLDFTSFISSTYDTYRIFGIGIAPATNGDDLRLEAGSGGGPTWDTGNSYEWVGNGWSTDGVARTNVGSTGIAKLLNAMSNTAAYGNGSFDLTLFAPQSTSIRKQIHGTYQFVDSAPANKFGVYGWSWTTSGTAMTGLRFIMSTGNIATGTIRIYGVAKS